MRMKTPFKNFGFKIIIIAALFLLTNAAGVKSRPPDNPLTPAQWIEKMGNGNWMIFNIEPDDFTFADVKYSADILDSLLSIGQTGGRLHFRPRSIMDTTNFQYDSAAINFLSKMIDDITGRGMGICLQYNPLWSDEEKNMDARAKEIYFKTWEQLCAAFKDKSHLLAMSPVIESHAWQNFGDKELMRDSLNWLYDSLTVIFRKYNPTRIISYKPWGAAKRAELYTLSFPFRGNHSNPDSGYYVASFSGSYGLGEWEDYGIWQNYTLAELKEQMMHAGKLNKPDLGIGYAVQWRKETGIQVWIDHWEPDYWKNGVWSAEQNLAYTEYFLDTLKALKIASSGPQTRRIWDDNSHRFFTDEFTQSFIRVLKKYNWRIADKIEKKDNGRVIDFKLNQNYPNPFNPTTTISYQISKRVKVSIKVYNLLGEEVTTLVNEIKNPGIYHAKFTLSDVSSGIYVYKMEAGNFQNSKKMLLLK